jgi:hypothetical protein
MRRREGSPWQGLGTVMSKEIADNLTGVRIRILEILAFLSAVGAVYAAVSVLRNTTSEDPFLFLRLFTTAQEPLPAFVAFLTFLTPLVAIALGFDAVNGEFNRRTLSRILAQPIYRDALLLGKYLAGLATLAIVLTAIWLLVAGLTVPGCSAGWRGGGTRPGVPGGHAGVWRGMAGGRHGVFGSLPPAGHGGAGGHCGVAVLHRVLEHHRRRAGAGTAPIGVWLHRRASGSKPVGIDAGAAVAEHALR